MTRSHKDDRHGHSTTLYLNMQHQSVWERTPHVQCLYTEHNVCRRVEKKKRIQLSPKKTTNIQHMHDETLTLPIHLQLHASQFKQKTQHCCCLPTPMTLASGESPIFRLRSTSQLLRPSGQQCTHSGGDCPQIQG